MRAFIAVLVLIFSLQSFTKADDIRDFQIEGMSVGDSLLDHFSKEEIEKEKKIRKLFKQKKGEYVSRLITDNPRFKVYEGVTLTWDPEDRDYELIGVTGHLYFRSEYNNCLKKRKEIIDAIEKIAGNAKKNDRGKRIHSYDKTGDSYFKEVAFELSGGGIIRASCMNWSEKITATNVWSDALNVIIVSEKFRKILSNKPY